MNYWWSFCAFLLLVFPLYGENEALRLYILEKVHSAPAGSVVTVPVQITNFSPHSLTLVNRLAIDGGIHLMETNRGMTHLGPMQSYQDLLRIKIPETASSGEYRYEYALFSETNQNILTIDQGTIVVQNAEVNEPQLFPPEPIDWLTIGDDKVDASPDEMIFLSIVVQNPLEESWKGKFKLTPPSGWHLAQFAEEEICLKAGESSLQLVGLKAPSNAMAGNFVVKAEVIGEVSSRQEILVRIKPVIEFSARIEADGSQGELICENNSNVAIAIQIKTTTDPICPLNLEQDNLTIPPYDSVRIPFNLDRGYLEDEEKQFILFKIFRDGCPAPLCQVPYCYDLIIPICSDDDPFIRIPSRLRTGVLGENHKTVGVIEVSGRGIIDEERRREIDYCVRLPTDYKNVIYSVDQRLYLGVSEPDWSVDLGDTVYALSPLTQYYRYGRGGGLDLSRQGINVGAHYTQNTFSNDYDPKEACAYLSFNPTPCYSIGANYLHKDLCGIPSSNMLTVESMSEPLPNIFLEMEAGNNFLSEKAQHDTRAFRIETRGRVFRDAWFDIEKVYAGYDFYGYYQAMNLFSSTIDTPLGGALRGNFNYTSLRQDYGSLDPDDPQTLSPRQKQGGATISYNFSNGMTLAANALLLRAREIGITEDYNFYQKWGGLNFIYSREGYTLNSSISIGQQKDYLTGKTTHCLQRYYTYLGKELSDRFYASCFYEGGHIDYFDVNPWRTSFGGSLRYRYQNGSWCDLFVQKVNHRHDDYELSQISFNLHHQFENKHSVDVSLQRFFYKNHYPSDSYFLVSYSIPFGLSLYEKNDRSDVCGTVFDSWNQCPIPNALVNVGGKQVKTNAEGRFSLPRTQVGPQSFKTDLLPGNLTSEEILPGSIDIQRGKRNEVMIACLPAVTLEGSLVLFEFKDDQLFDNDTSLIEAGGLRGIRVTIDRDHGKEIYTSLTDRNGKFRFPKLRPGNWRVYVNEEQLPKLHSLNLNDFTLELVPGEEKVVDLKVLPEKRIMQSL